MSGWRKSGLQSEIATVFAVLAMLLQVILSPLLMEQSAFAAESIDDLSIICSFHTPDDQDATSSGIPAADHHVHDCPCCAATGGHVVLPEPAAFAAPRRIVAFVSDIGWVKPQVADIATVSAAQLPRAPPRLQ